MIVTRIKKNRMNSPTGVIGAAALKKKRLQLILNTIELYKKQVDEYKRAFGLTEELLQAQQSLEACLLKRKDDVPEVSQLNRNGDVVPEASQFNRKADDALEVSQLERKDDKVPDANQLSRKDDDVPNANQLNIKDDIVLDANQLNRKAVSVLEVSQLERKDDDVPYANQLNIKGDNVSEASELSTKDVVDKLVLDAIQLIRKGCGDSEENKKSKNSVFFSDEAELRASLLKRKGDAVLEASQLRRKDSALSEVSQLIRKIDDVPEVSQLERKAGGDSEDNKEPENSLSLSDEIGLVRDSLLIKIGDSDSEENKVQNKTFSEESGLMSPSNTIDARIEKNVIIEDKLQAQHLLDTSQLKRKGDGDSEDSKKSNNSLSFSDEAELLRASLLKSKVTRKVIAVPQASNLTSKRDVVPEASQLTMKIDAVPEANQLNKKGDVAESNQLNRKVDAVPEASQLKRKGDSVLEASKKSKNTPSSSQCNTNVGKERNVIIRGLKVHHKETSHKLTMSRITCLLKKWFKIEVEFEFAYRMTDKQAIPPLILARFKDLKTKIAIMERKDEMYQIPECNNIFIHEDRGLS